MLAVPCRAVIAGGVGSAQVETHTKPVLPTSRPPGLAIFFRKNSVWAYSNFAPKLLRYLVRVRSCLEFDMQVDVFDKNSDYRVIETFRARSGTWMTYTSRHRKRSSCDCLHDRRISADVYPCLIWRSRDVD